MRRGGLGLLGMLVAMVVGAPAAGAAVPTGNLLPNPGAEAGSGSASGNDLVTIPGWTRVSVYGGSPQASEGPGPTVVRYGAPAFPTVAQGAALGGGTNFFAGGPSAGNDTTTTGYDAYLESDVALPRAVQPEVSAGDAQYALSACLGGYADQNDYASIFVYAEDSTGQGTASWGIDGPEAVHRGGVTELLPEARSGPLDPRTRFFKVVLDFYRESGPNTYNDGYADNVSLRVVPAGASIPAPDCPPPGGGSTPKAPSPSKTSGTNTAAGVSRVGRRLTLKGKYALVQLHCALRDTSCKGTLSLAATGLPKVHKSTIAKHGAKAAKLGAAKFTIAQARTKTVKVKLGRSVRQRLSALSKKRLKKLKITATAKIGSRATKFSLGAVRKH
jgi:hypothetical protein